MLMFSGFIYSLTGDPFRWMPSQGVWGRASDNLTLLVNVFRPIGNEGMAAWLAARPADAMNFLATAFAALLLVPITWRLGWIYGTFTALNLFAPLLLDGLTSMGRHTSVLFPLFLFLAAVIPTARHLTWASGFGVTQGFVAAAFYTWRPLY
jgi:hypothetical protein